MALFTFTAVRQGGEKFSGEREAESKHALIEALKAEGATALSASELRHASRGRQQADGSFLKRDLTIPFLTHVPNGEKILFARNLSAMNAAGLPLSRALAILEKQTKNALMRKTIAAVGEEIKQGKSLSEALAAHPAVFSKLFVAMSHAGEESGTLSESLKIVATQMERSYTLTKKIRGAMMYPAIVITVMIGIGILMLIFVVPTLSSTFAEMNAQLPLPTQIILGLSNFIISHTIAFVAGAVALVILAVLALRSTLGRRMFDRGVLAIPVIGAIVAKVNAARTARTLASLLSSGVSALTALDITREVVQNTRFRPVLAEAHDLVEKGKPISDAFIAAEKIYPIMFSEMAAVGEETGDISGMLSKVADFYEDEVEQQTKDLSTIIEPILMVFIGGGVGFFAIAMIMPIYSLSGSIG